jgi:hypothetical protein
MWTVLPLPGTFKMMRTIALCDVLMFRCLCRLTSGEDRMDEPLVKMRFICRQFWSALFGRHVGGLKTNHKVMTMIHDNHSYLRLSFNFKVL